MTQDGQIAGTVGLTHKGPAICSGGDLLMLSEAEALGNARGRFRHAATTIPPQLPLDRMAVRGVCGAAVKLFSEWLGLAQMGGGDALIARER